MAKSLIMAALLAALLQTIAAQEVHVVGGSLGWIVPPGGPIAYRTWAATQTFSAGDILLFNFTTGDQDVARVTKEAFDSCNSTNPIWIETKGPVNFTLSSGGEYYFISTMDSHCYLGQKLAINVTGSTGPTASPASPAPATPRAPVTYVVGGDLGWIVPPGGPIAYSGWAYDKTFMVGDILVFNFTTGQQDVAGVSKEAFDSCNSTSHIWIETNGPFNFTLTSAGEYYFIGTMERHCFLGQKLAINVTGTSGGPTASPAPPQPPPSSPRVPVTYVVGDDLGWLVPPGGSIAYSTWADGKTFIVGDTLLFNFTNGTQDVAVVTKAMYDSCDTSATIAVLTTSPAKYTLAAAGKYYFTSTYARHCALGQKLTVDVVGASSTAVPPSESTSPSGANAEFSPAGAPTPGAAAPSRVLTGFFYIAFVVTGLLL